MRKLSWIAAVVLLGCGETGQHEIAYPLFVAGRGPAPFLAGSWEVTLEVARIGLGPIYFCATAAASSDLCPIAVAEFAASVEIDALDPTARQAGQIRGVTGTVRSATFDYAVTWLPTQSSPTPTRAAPNGHSAYFEGRATRGATTVRFVADIDAWPSLAGTRVVQGARLSADVPSDAVRLEVTLDPAAWWRDVDFDEVAMQPGDPVRIGLGSRAHNAVVLAMTSSVLPSFAWSRR